ncbi:MAG: nucleotidyl transferase AbiEii/AbiGii toxin family protein [Bacteroidales bacterium]|nr:nucleotidyl transferase AbiEii/AbiGii toxin family protein [Bacteroidales bacterium]
MNAEQLKGKIRYYSQQTKLPPQEILQMYLFERILERMSSSKYSNNFILKGGLLISSMLGIAERSTMDMDVTVRGINMDENTVIQAVNNILDIDGDDDIRFVFKKIEHIREDDEYFNFRVHFNAVFGKINCPMKIDITTGDIITPRAVEYSYKSLFDDKTIPVMAYNKETVIAEKYETIIRRNIANTRARDFYDLYKFFKLYRYSIDPKVLKSAVKNTAQKRNSTSDIDDAIEIINEMRDEKYLQNLWKNYTATYAYAANITFNDLIDNLLDVTKFIK